MKKEFIISSEQVDGIVYASTKSRLEEQADKFDAAISTFIEYGLPTDLEFLKSNSADMALRKYLDQKAQVEITSNGGFLCEQSIRAEIINKCVNTYNAVKISAKVIHETIIRPVLPIIENGGRLTLDRTKIDELARIAASYRVDAEKLMEYHKLINDVRLAMAKAKEFEDANGLKHFSEGDSIDFAGVFAGQYAAPHIDIKLSSYFANFEDSPENWTQAFGNKFRL